MRPALLAAGAALLFALGLAGGLMLARPTTEFVEVPVASANAPSTHGDGAVVSADDAARLRERVRELEDRLAEHDGLDEPGTAENLLVPERPTLHRMDLGSGMTFEGSVDGELPPEIAARIATALEDALGGGTLDCEGEDCVMIGPDGQPMPGVQIQTIGDIDPAEMGAMLQQALGDGVMIGEPSVGVMVIEAEGELVEE
ncbi:MAG: hypothetical protein EP330_08040 [Deltaproteobacteria bacterium]|nr:MAG: hypothetical protein EP330_08040 [Deltaproteobacteria bacterium]